MSRVEERFQELKKRNEKALVCFLTAGDPDIETSEALVLEVVAAGADIIEIGIPFSDPLADGPSIQESTKRALGAGMNPHKALDLVRSIRNKTDVPIVLMTYFNPVQKIGMSVFAGEAAMAGADGVILTDLPPDEAGDWKFAAEQSGLDTVFLLAPTSTEERVKKVADIGSGFIYCVSRTGVTGARAELSADVNDLVAKVRKFTDKPVAVGFGVSGPDQVREICKSADGAVVGSALVDIIASKRGQDDLIPEVRSFVTSLKEATRDVG